MRVAFALLSCLLFASRLSMGQVVPTKMGKLVGSITDTRAKPIANAEILVLDLANPAKRIRETAVNGVFSIAVPPSYYSLEVSANNYEPTRTKTVRVFTSDAVMLDVQLQDRASGLVAAPPALWSLFSVSLTILAGLILPPLASWWNRPQLRFDVQAIEPYSHRFHRQFFPGNEQQQASPTLGGEIGSEVAGAIGFYFTRIRVTNKGRREEAEDVDISISRVATLDGKDVPELKHFIPANLRWSNTWDVAEAGKDKASASEVLVKSRISARGGQRFCDLGFIVEPERITDFCQIGRVGQQDSLILPSRGKVLFILALDYIRPWLPRSLKPGQYWLELLCDAKHMKPSLFWIQLSIPDKFVVQNESENIKICCKDKRPSSIQG